MCKGKVLIHPCSRVGHVVYPYDPFKKVSSFFYKTSYHIAAVWFTDKLKEIFRLFAPKNIKKVCELENVR